MDTIHGANFLVLIYKENSFNRACVNGQDVTSMSNDLHLDLAWRDLNLPSSLKKAAIKEFRPQ